MAVFVTKMFLRSLRVGLLATLCLGAVHMVAAAATPAETLIAGNIQTGLGILGDKKLTAADRWSQLVRIPTRIFRLRSLC